MGGPGRSHRHGSVRCNRPGHVFIEAKRRNAQVRARFNREFGFVERAFVEYGAKSSRFAISRPPDSNTALKR